MSNKYLLFLTILIFIVYTILSNQFYDNELIKNVNYLTFLIGVPAESNIRIFMFWYLVFAAYSFYFTGSIYKYLNGYGKNIIVRNYNLNLLIIKRFLSIGFILLLLVIIQSVISIFYYSLNNHIIIELSYLSIFIKSLTLYFLSLLSIIFIQLFLELFFLPHICFLLTNIYVVLSIHLFELSYSFNNILWANYILVPNFSMLLRLNLIEQDIRLINYHLSIYIVLFIIILTFSFSLIKIKKTDIY